MIGIIDHSRVKKHSFLKFEFFELLWILGIFKVKNVGRNNISSQRMEKSMN